MIMAIVDVDLCWYVLVHNYLNQLGMLRVDDADTHLNRGHHFEISRERVSVPRPTVFERL